MSRNERVLVVATITALFAVLVAPSLFYSYYRRNEQPLMIVIDGAPHLRGAHQQKPGVVNWTPPSGGSHTEAGADVLREGTERHGRVSSTGKSSEASGVRVRVPSASTSLLGDRQVVRQEALNLSRASSNLAPRSIASLAIAQVCLTASTNPPRIGDQTVDIWPTSAPSRKQTITYANNKATWNGYAPLDPSGVYQFEATSQPSGVHVTWSVTCMSKGTPAQLGGVINGRSDDQALQGDLDAGSRVGGIDSGAGNDDASRREEGGRRAVGAAAVPLDAGLRRLAQVVGTGPWTNVTAQPWTTNSAATAVTRKLSMTALAVAETGISRQIALDAIADNRYRDCRPSLDTTFTPSAAAWIAKANAWADAIDAKFPRSIAASYDRLRCNGSIPFGWYVSTHNLIDGAAFSDETPVEWMCRQRMDSPLAQMMVRTLPVMRPTFGGPYDSVLISYNDHDARIAVGVGTEYAGCGMTADKPCVFRAPFSCVWPMEKMYDDGKGGAVAVVSGWDITPPGRLEVGPKEAQP